MKVEIKPPDTSKWDRIVKGALSPNEFNKAMARAINDALAAAKTQALKGVTDRYTIKRKEIADLVSTRKASGDNPGGMLRFRSQRKGLAKFKTRPAAPPIQSGVPVERRKAVQVELLKGHGFTLPKGFVAQMRSGHIGVFRREGAERLGIDERTGPTIAHMVGSREVIENVQERADEVLNNRIDHHIARALAK